jgi:hypothetical protein
MTAEQLSENFDELMNFIQSKFKGERLDQLANLYNELAPRIATAPASSKKQYHNAFEGGYVLHILNVIKACEKLSGVWEDMGMIPNFTKEEMYFSALNHDLGKIGSMTEDYYIPCEEEWMKKKGQVFVTNPKLQYMKVPERSLMLLQSNGISISEVEYLSIKLHDGLYEDSNKAYFINYNEDMALKSNLPYILHQADLICAKMEGQTSTTTSVKKTTIKAEAVKTGNRTLDKFLNE